MERFFHFLCFRIGEDDDLSFFCADEGAGFSVQEGFHRSCTQDAGQLPVSGSGLSAPLDEAQDGGADIDIRPLFQPVAEGSSVVSTFGADDDGIRSSRIHLKLQGTGQLFAAEGDFRYQDVFSAAGKACIEGDISCEPTHHFHDGCPVVGGSRIADAAYRSDHCIDCRIMADGFIGSVHIVINRTGHGDRGDAQVCQLLRSLDGAVPADDDQSVDAPFPEDVGPFLLVRFFEKFFAPGRFQDGPAPEDDSGNGRRIHGYHIIFDESGIPAVNAVNFFPIVKGRAHDASYSRIHARRIAAAGEYCQSIHSISSLV